MAQAAVPGFSIPTYSFPQDQLRSLGKTHKMHVEGAYASPADRYTALAKKLERLNLPIFCLQQCDPECSGVLQKQLQDYGVCLQKDGAVFYKRKEFQQVASEDGVALESSVLKTRLVIQNIPLQARAVIADSKLSSLQEAEYVESTERMKLFQAAGYEAASSVARQKEHRPLNRFGHILPYDKTLVRTERGYINANSVFDGRYILTQLPPEQTIDTFWQMIAERGSQVVVMLNEQKEDPKAIYWPEAGKSRKFGPLTITNQKEERIVVPAENEADQPSIIIRRKLILAVPGQKDRIVNHLHMTNWKDDTGGDVNCLLKLAELADKHQGASKAPIVVHCKGGVGRTGVFTVIHNVRSEVRKGKQADVHGSLEELRHPNTGRWHLMVSTSAQYLTCYRAMEREILSMFKGHEKSQLLGRLIEQIEPLKARPASDERTCNLHALFKTCEKVKHAVFVEIGKKRDKKTKQDQFASGQAHFADDFERVQKILAKMLGR